MQVLILAGGRGMRLNPLTDEMPPTLLQLPGGTILDHLIRQIDELPVSKVGVVLQYHGDRIAAHLGNHGIDAFTIPQYSPFTLLGSLASAAPWIEEPTLVLHGNYYFSRPLNYFLQEADPHHATFLLDRKQLQRGDVGGAGVYLLPPHAFYLAAQYTEFQGLETFQKVLARTKLPVSTLPLQGWARHVHWASDLLAVSRFVLSQWHEVPHPEGAAWGYDAMHCNWIAPNADVDDTVSGIFTAVGPHCYVRRSHLNNVLLFPQTRLEDTDEENAVLTRTGKTLLRLYAPTTMSRTMVAV